MDDFVTYVPATDVRVGDMVVERDGAAFRVATIGREGRAIVFGLDNVHRYRIAPDRARVSARSKVRIERREGDALAGKDDGR